jgi:hypothetical protein
MSAKKAVITRKEFESNVGNRVSPRYGPGPFRIEEKEFVDSIQIGDPHVIRYDGEIKDLDFYDCIFNETVEIGNHNQAGKVTFTRCVFDKPVKTQYGNSSFDKECIFNDTLSIHANKETAVNISNIVVNGLLEITGEARDFILGNINEGQYAENQKIKISAKSNNFKSSRISRKIYHQKHQSK